MPPLRRNLGQGLQYEQPLLNTWMGQKKRPPPAPHGIGRFADESVIVEKIEVERPRSPADTASPPGRKLDFMQPPHQGFRRQMCRNLRNRIHEGWLVSFAEWLGDEKPRCTQQRHSPPVELLERPLNRVPRSSPGAADICTQSNNNHLALRAETGETLIQQGLFHLGDLRDEFLSG